MLIKKPHPKISVIPASLNDYSIIQKMIIFYFYDLSRECTDILSEWSLSKNDFDINFYFKNYLEDPSRKAYLIKISNEVAGFVLLNQATENKNSIWAVGEFFIIAKFQGQGIGKEVAHQIWKINPGQWEVPVIPENKKALLFWEKVIADFTKGKFYKRIMNVTYDEQQPKRIVFTFDTKENSIITPEKIIIRKSILDDAQSVASVHVRAWQESYAGIVSPDYLVNISVEEKLDLRKKILLKDSPDEIHLVAVYEGEIIGFCDAGPTSGPSSEQNEQYRGEIYTIYLLNKFKSLGIGTKLLQEAQKHLIEKNLSPYIICVLKDNTIARNFYEKKGFVFLTEKNIRMADRSYVELCYIFKNPPLFRIRASIPSDIERLVELSKAKRLSYEKAQPQFWRYAGPEAEISQRNWFSERLSDENYIMLTAENDEQKIVGFIMGQLIKAPEVYNPGGLTLMIDDFCVKTEDLWSSVGTLLLQQIKKDAYNRGARQIIVVSGAHDAVKRTFLMQQNLSLASEWFVGTAGGVGEGFHDHH